MAGTLAVPNDFAAKSGNVPASQIDANFTAVEGYVNDREIVADVLASRPSASKAGRWYFATDVNGGTLYMDSGSAWIQVAAALAAGGVSVYQVRGLTGANNSGTPFTQYDLAADAVVLWSPSDGSTVLRTATGTITNNISTTGPAANGRDQGSAFSANSWLHFYLIWNGTTLASVSSTAAPPTGPTLPSGYTHWAYAGAVRYDSNPRLVATRMRGTWGWYDAQQAALADGRATTETAVSLTALIPTNALTWSGHFRGLNQVASNQHYELRVVTGVTWRSLRLTTGGSNDNDQGQMTVPNVAQNLYYLYGGDPTGGLGLCIDVVGYQVPNGGE